MRTQNYWLLWLCLMLMPVGSSAAVDSSLPLVIDLCGNWDFTYTKHHTEQTPESDAFKTTMPVPACWDDHLGRLRAHSFWSDANFNPAHVIEYPVKTSASDASLPYLLGTGWYRRQINVPADWNGRQITLHIGRVVMEAWVYVNGRCVHHHVGLSTTWEVPLMDNLHFGRSNELIIAVDNTRTDLLGCMIRGYKGRSAGIFGPVTLKVAGPIRIADLYVHPKDDKLNWRVELKGQITDAELQWKVYDRQSGQTLGQARRRLNGTMSAKSASGKRLEWTTGMLGMKRWSDREPNLYEIEISLWSGGKCIDMHHQRFGLRRLTAKGFGLRLNGNPIYLRGVCDIAYYPRSCTPPTDVQFYRQHIQRLKQLGFNWLRFHTFVPLEPYLEAADELGMLIQVEPPRGFQQTQWLDILQFCRKHPSVVIYCCGNEELLDEAKIEFLRQCASDCRKLAPDALFNPQEALRGVEYYFQKKIYFGDGFVKEPYPHNPVRLEKLKSFSDVFGQYAWGMLSYGTLGGEPRKIDKRLAAYERPCLSHELGIIGCYLNLDLEHRYAGSRIGTALFASIRRNLAHKGLLERASLYYRNSCAWQRLLRKDVVETARKTHRVAGYDMLGANDNHWHRTGYGCGLMNEFDELKPGDSVDDVLAYNGPSVLLLDEQRKRNLRAGQPFNVDLLVSWFGNEILKDATAEWYLQSDDGFVFCCGEQAVKPVEPGHIKKIMRVAFKVPDIEQPIKTQLHVRLSSPHCELSNRWSYWIFPPVSVMDMENSDVMVVSELDANNLKHLTRGGRVVLFGHKPFAARETSFQMAVAGRTRENLATVIADHPITTRFPNDGYCDWQFYPMFNHAVTIVFDEMENAFDPIIEVVSSYKLISKQSSLFEWRVGQGRLLVCTLKLPDSDPAAAYLKKCILDYAGSDRFHPRTYVAPQEIANRLKIKLPGPEKQHKTDQAFDPFAQQVK